MQIVDVEVAKINPFANNPRNHRKSLSAVVSSIRQFGFRNPILLDKNNEIICGHTRFFAARKLGLEKVPCVIADDMSPVEVAAFRLVDNRTGELSTWDAKLFEQCIQEIRAMPDFEKIDWLDFSFDKIGLPFSTKAAQDDFDEDAFFDGVTDENCGVKDGDIFRLGRHVVMCGDSLDGANLQKLVNAVGSAADLVCTDPPYGVHYSGCPGCKRENLANDDVADATEFYSKILRTSAAFMKDGATAYFFYGVSKINLAALFDKSPLKYMSVITWCKNHATLNRGHYKQMSEPCVAAYKGRVATWNGGNKQKNIWCDVDKMNEIDLRNFVKAMLNEECGDVCYFQKPTVSKLHPTQKPVPLIDWLIHNSSNVGDVVFDFFGGSGTTLVACEQNGRRAALCELRPKYVAAQIARWEELTGLKAEKI